MEQPLLHAANILYLISYSVRDILWLRVITILAMLLLGGYYLATDQLMPCCWQLAFLGINFFQVHLLIRERRPVVLTEVQESMHKQALAPLTRQQVKRLMELGIECRALPGDEILQQDVTNKELILLTAGIAYVYQEGLKLAELTAGKFAGEMSFLTGELTCASVEAKTSLDYIVWDEQTLRQISERDQSMGLALQSALGADVVYKLLDERSRHVRGVGFDARGTLTLPAG